MKKYFSILCLCLSAIILSSCGKTVLFGREIHGNAINALSETTLARLNAYEIPNEVHHIEVRVDSICPVNDYLDKIKFTGDGIAIHAFLEPRLIRADIYGPAGVELIGSKNKEYLSRQIAYARGESIDQAVMSMLDLLVQTQCEAVEKYSTKRKMRALSSLKDFVDNITGGLLFFFKPYDNLWGTILKPIYVFNSMCITKTWSILAALLLQAFLLAVAITWFFFKGFVLNNRNKKGLGSILVLGSVAVSMLSSIVLVISSVFLLVPKYENILVMQNRYGFKETSAIIDAYASHDFMPSSVWILVVAILVFFIHRMILVYSHSSKLSEEEMDMKAEEEGEKLGEAMVPLLGMALFAAVVDKMIILAFIVFYIMKILLSVYAILVKNRAVAEWILTHSKKFTRTILLVGVVGYVIFTSFERNSDESSLFYSSGYAFAREIFSEEQIDSVSYIQGMELANKVLSDSKMKPEKVEIRDVWCGMSEIMRSRQDLVRYPEGKTYSRTDSKAQNYRLGYEFGNLLKANHYISRVGELSYVSFVIGYKSAIEGKIRPQYSARSAEIMREWRQKRDSYIAQRNLEEGKAYLESQRLREEVKVTRSGLQYIIHNPGTGRKATRTSIVSCEYTGYLTDGSIFDQGEISDVNIGGLINGWREGLCLLAPGGEATLYIPSRLAHGSKWCNQIEPNSVLTYRVKLLSVK